MNGIILHLKGLMIAIVVLALSASLTFGAQAPAGGYAIGGSFEDNSGSESAGEDEDTDGAGTEETGEEEADEAGEEDVEGAEDVKDVEDAEDNCLTDPSALTPDELALMSHGSMVCWAAHQTEWPEWFSNHGKFVSCWAHQGKPGAPSCTEAPVANVAAATPGNGKGKGQAQGKGHTP